MIPPADDGSIPDDACLLRRIHPAQIIEDQNTKERRPSSAAFKDPEMSVDAEPKLIEAGLDWKSCLEGYEGYSLVNVKAKEARSKALVVAPTPLTENPAHAEVYGKKTQGIANHLRNVATWVHLEPAASI